MYRDKRIGVIVPAHNEEKLISKTIKSIPDFVDRIIVVDDCSTDGTLAIVKKLKQSIGERLVIVHHKKNCGVGGAMVTAYKESLKHDCELIALMAGDAQMDPADLPVLLDTAIDKEIDYVKGNRLLHKNVRNNMPKHRYIGNSILTILNKIATGYWKTMDPQCGYTVINRLALETIPLERLYPWYGVPNDMLVMLNVYNFKVKDVVVNPVYGIEKSGIKLYSYIPKVSFLLLRRFFWRLKEKYLFRDFHPLALFYILGIVLSPLGFLYGLMILITRFAGNPISMNAVLLSVFLMIMGIQFLLFGMLFDMEYNKGLNE